MTQEVRVFAEGSVRWAVASGTGVAWATASAAATGLVGYVQVGSTFSRGRTVFPVQERGVVDHFKSVQPKLARDFTLTFLQGNTGSYPPTATTGAGASLPLVHFEVKHNLPEVGSASATYHLFVFCAFESEQWTEEQDGNKYQQKWKAIDIIGPTASGYLATGGQ